MLLSAVALVSIAVLSARVPLSAEGVSGHTLLWILPDADGSQRLQIGVESQEFVSAGYRLVISTDGGGVLHARPINLDPKTSWIGSMAVPPDVSRIDVRLTRDGVGGTYRSVHLVVGDEQA